MCKYWKVFAVAAVVVLMFGLFWIEPLLGLISAALFGYFAFPSIALFAILHWFMVKRKGWTSYYAGVVGFVCIVITFYVNYMVNMYSLSGRRFDNVFEWFVLETRYFPFLLAFVVSGFLTAFYLIFAHKKRMTY